MCDPLKDGFVDGEAIRPNEAPGKTEELEEESLPDHGRSRSLQVSIIQKSNKFKIHLLSSISFI